MVILSKRYTEKKENTNSYGKYPKVGKERAINLQTHRSLDSGK
jgi:hypothetical protein